MSGTTVTVERMIAEIEVNPAQAIAGLEAFDTAVKSLTGDETKNIDVDVDEASYAGAHRKMNSLSRDEVKTIRVHVDNNALAGAMSALTGDLSKIVGMMEGMGEKAGKGAEALAEGTQNATEALTGGGKGGGKGGGMMGALKGAWGAASGFFSAVMAIGQVAWVGLIIFAVAGAATILAGALQMVVAAAVGAVATLTPLLGLLGGIPVLAGVAVGSIAPLMLGLKEVFTVSGLMTKATKDATKSNYDAEAAARSLADAQRNLRDAIEGVAKAREQAKENLQDTRFGMRQAVLSEADAVDALRRAQEHLEKVQNNVGKNAAVLSQETDDFTGKVYDVARVSADAATKGGETAAEAARKVAEAQLHLEEAIEHTKRQREDLTRAEKKGIEGSDLVVGALQRVSDAQYALLRAQRAMTEQTKHGTAAMDALNEAMKKLGPSGQHLARYISKDLMPAFDDIKRAAGEGLAPGIEKGLRSMMTLMPLVKDEMKKWGTAIGNAFGELGAHLASPKVRADMKELSDGMLKLLTGTDGKNGKKGLLDALVPIADMLISITKAAMPMMTVLTDQMVTGLEKLSTWMQKPENAKVMEDFFTGGVVQLGKWVDVLKPTFGIMKELLIAAKPLADWMLTTLADNLTSLEKQMKTKQGKADLQKFFTGMEEAIKQTMGVIGDLFTAIMVIPAGGEDSALVNFLKAIRSDLIPALSDFFTLMTENKTLATDFVQMLSSIVDGITQMMDDLWILTNPGGDMNDSPSAVRARNKRIAEQNKDDAIRLQGERAGQPGYKQEQQDVARKAAEKKYDKEHPSTGGFLTFERLKPGEKSAAEKARDGKKKAGDDAAEAVRLSYFGKPGRDQNNRLGVWSKEGIFKITPFVSPKDAAQAKKVAADITAQRKLKISPQIDAKGKVQIDKNIAALTATRTFLLTPKLPPTFNFMDFISGGNGGAERPIDDPTLPSPQYNSATGRAYGAINPLTGQPYTDRTRWSGGPVKKGEQVVVGENRAELFTPTDNGRIAPSVPTSTGGGLTEEQMSRLLESVLAKAKPNNTFEQTFMEKQDPKLLSSEMAWSLR